MSNDPPEVDWSLLPSDPSRFFGVEPGFNRKDLKRNYNRLIRHFKPEKFPEEFQKIRAAYEALEQRLRYGQSTERAEDLSAEYFWPVDHASDLPASSAGNQRPVTTPDGPGEPVSLRQRVEQEPLEKVYQDLAAQSTKTAYEYYALAVISDLLHKQSELLFLRWILRGLQEHPDEPGLSHLLYEYLRSPIPAEAVETVLTSVAETLRDDAFYVLTEPLWQQLLQSQNFADFRRILDRCTAKVSNIQIDGKLIFLVELLKGAIWTAPPDWVEETANFIEQNYGRLPPQLQFDLDLLDLIHRYAALRNNFRESHPLLRRMDQAIQDFFTQGQIRGDQSVLACQTRMAENPQEVLQAIEFELEDRYAEFYALWSYLTAEVAARHAVEVEPPDLNIWRTRGRALFERIEQRINSSAMHFRSQVANGAYGVLIGGLYLSIVVAATLVLTVASIEIDYPMVVLFVLFGSIACGLLAARWIHHRYLYPRREAWLQKRSIQAYVQYGRPELAEFLHRTHFGYQDLRQLMEFTSISNLLHAQNTFSLYLRDYGLAIYAGSLAFRA